MSTLHTFGCSITQGFALPDVVKPICDSQGQPLSLDEVNDLDIHWTDIHLYQPSDYAWPAELARRLNMPVVNHARRGSCFNQISRQCALAKDTIKPEDTVIVMWTYLSRISLQWPARTSVPFSTNIIPTHSWKTMITGFNKFFGLAPSPNSDQRTEAAIQQYIYDSTRYTYMTAMGIYNRYYNNLVLQTMTAGFLQSTGARVIHLSVETESSLDQLEQARSNLDQSLREPYNIPDPRSWYALAVDHDLCRVILDPSIPPAENDTHPSVQHHSNFAAAVYERYFS